VAGRRQAGGPPGGFITLEGIEGCGKTTQAALLADAFREARLAVTATREPGGTRLAERLRRLVLDAEAEGFAPEGELFLYLAARCDHVARRIAPALAEGRWVICDRYTDATLAYQGYGRELDVERVRRLLDWAGGPRPDLTLLFDVPVETGLERAGRRGATNRLDREGDAFHHRVRDGYLALAKAEPERIVVLDGTAPVDAVRAAMLAAVRARFGDRLGDALAAPAGGRT
jgi:dTMP kinase